MIDELLTLIFMHSKENVGNPYTTIVGKTHSSITIGCEHYDSTYPPTMYPR